MKGSHKVLPTQYSLTTLSLAQVASHLSQNSSPFLVSLPLLYDLKNVVVNVVVLMDFNSVLMDFNSVLTDSNSALVDFNSVLVNFDSALVDFGSDCQGLRVDKNILMLLHEEERGATGIYEVYVHE